MPVRIEVDESLCSGYGSCVAQAPQLFELVDDRARARVAVTDDPAAYDARDACPMGAIELEEV
jgi:ferredoxin